MFGSFPDELLSEFYAAYAEAAKTQKDCGPGERVVFGKCAKGDNMGNKQIDEAQKKERASTGTPDNSKPVMVNGKRMGWAIQNGKKVLVDYGSVAGEKKVGPKQPETKPAEASKEKSAQAPTSSPREKMAQKANDPALSDHDRAVAGLALSVADRSAYKAGGGNAAAMRGMGSSTQQVIEQGKKNLDRMDQGRGRS